MALIYLDVEHLKITIDFIQKKCYNIIVPKRTERK